jgi:hypothetical protein
LGIHAVKITPDEWLKLFKLRDELEDEGDRVLVRKLIKRIEYLEKKMRAIKHQLEELE